MNPQASVNDWSRTEIRIALGEKLEVRLYESLDALQGLLPAWEELLSEFRTATIFSTWEWLVPWWRAFSENQRLMVFGFFDSNDRLVALAPLASTKLRTAIGLELQCLKLMGDGSQDSDNLDVPVRPGYEKQVARTLLDYLESNPDFWDLSRFNTLPTDSPFANALLQELERRHWIRFTESRPRLVVDLPASWEEYLQRLSKRERKQVRNEGRHLEKGYSVRYLKCIKEDELKPALQTLFRLHQKRWELRGERGSFACRERQQFYEELSLGLLKRDWLEFWLLELNGVTVAAQFGLRYRDTVFALQVGFDPAYSASSVGFLLTAHVLQRLIEDGVREYDFLAGGGQAKERWGTRQESYTDVHFARQWTFGSSYLLAFDRSAAAKAQLRAHLPRWAWNLLHILNVKLRGESD
jgi:Acetyltransferase (GNAT) domain